MEQSGYWMWEKRKHNTSSLGSTNNPSYDHDSWEEQAFAEDTAGILGGCVWPPRSYSCSFCRREFRSAQALGGHMNVHRRDRARLKQSPCSQDEIRHHDDLQIHQSSVQDPFASLSYLYPSKVCGLAFSINPNSDPSTVVVSPSSEPSAASAPPAAEIFCADKLFPPYDSSMVRENHKYPVCNYSPKSSSPLVEEKNVYSDHDKFNSKNDCQQKDSKILNAGRRGQDDYLKTDLSVSLNLVVCRAQPALEYETRDREETAMIGCKRKRKDSTIPWFLNSTSADHQRHQTQTQTHPKVFEISPNPIEELDLELRLGLDRPLQS